MHPIEGGITSVDGFSAGGLSAKIKKNGRPDLALIFSETPCIAAARFTKNQFPAAPLLLCKKHLQGGVGQAVIVNSGNANAFTGNPGEADALAMAVQTAKTLGIPTRSVFVASTGVIGDRLPVNLILKALPQLAASLSREGGKAAAEAIMTTDTFSKETAWEGPVGESTIRIGGIAKGAGMIHPDMATMLSFLTTDVAISQDLLAEALREAIDESFHRITVDGDTSTNDMVLLLANGRKGKIIQEKGPSFRAFVNLLKQACLSLAKMLVKDGEGATKLIEIHVSGAADNDAAKKIAFEIASSSLVKTAFFGEDANWGRIVAAIGNAGVNVSPEEIGIAFGDTALIEHGKYMGDDVEKTVTSYLKNREIVLNISLRSGKGTFTVWTSDLSLDYVKINASYRT